MEHPLNDLVSSKPFHLIKRRLSTNQDLPTLPEGRVFELEHPSGSIAATDSEITQIHSGPLIAKKNRCSATLRLPRRLRNWFNWLYQKIGGVITYMAFFLLIYALLLIFTDKEALPPECYDYSDLISSDKKGGKVALCFGGKTLSITLFYAFAFAAGEAIELIKVPGLAGMLISGLLLRTISVFTSPYEILVDGVPFNDSTTSDIEAPLVSSDGPPFNFLNSTRLITNPIVTLAAIMRVGKGLSSSLRQIALATILTRAGLGLKPSTLRRTWSGVLRLTCIPCFTEAFACTVVAKYLMNWPWSWAFMMGFVLAAVSPAVVVPNMLRLEIAGWGMAAGIPTLVMAAASLDDVLAITGFGVAQAIAFSHGNIVQVAVKGPAGVAVGALSGMVLAVIICVLPPPGMEHSNSLRGMLLFGISISAITGTLKVDLPGAGALCCLVCALCCSYGWQRGIPWRFKQIASNMAPYDQDAHNAEDRNFSEDNEIDEETNAQKSKSFEGSQIEAMTAAETMHHEYYQQHLRSLRKLLKKSGGVAGSRNALSTVSRSTRRFSLPEPKPEYEEEEFDEMLDKLRRSKLTRSFSATRPSHSRATGNQTTNDNIHSALNMDVVTEEGSNMDSSYEVASNTNASSVATGSKGRTGTILDDPVDKDPKQVENSEFLELAKVKGTECLKVMRGFISTCWWFLQPLLFCLIGADIPVEKLKGPAMLRGILSITIALCFRFVASFLAVLPSKMNMKERLFVAISWIPKATVQAAIGPLALDSARKMGNPDYIKWGEEIITLAALSIIITAPTAAFFIPVVAPHLLQQHDPEQASAETGEDVRNQNDSANKTGIHDTLGSNKRKKTIDESYEILRQGPEPDVEMIPSTHETAL